MIQFDSMKPRSIGSVLDEITTPRRRRGELRHESLDLDCHSERSEESRPFKSMRPFTSFRATSEDLFFGIFNAKETLEIPP
jgi:hypothetical protein